MNIQELAKNGDFQNNTWTPETLSAVDSAIFWGYFVTQIPGGLIAAAYPANRLFGAAIGSSCLLNLCIPAIYEKPDFLIVIKVLQGLVEVRKIDTSLVDPSNKNVTLSNL